MFRAAPKIFLCVYIALFAGFVLFDIPARQGWDIPGPGLCLASCLACAALFLCARILRRSGEAESRDLGVVLYALIPELWLWLMLYPEYVLLSFRINTLLWAVLCIGIVCSSGSYKSWRRLLTLFLLKGVWLFFLNKGLFNAPWLFRDDSLFIFRVVLMYPLLFLACYQVVVLGYLWRGYERRIGKSEL